MYNLIIAIHFHAVGPERQIPSAPPPPPPFNLMVHAPSTGEPSFGLGVYIASRTLLQLSLYSSKGINTEQGSLLWPCSLFLEVLIFLVHIGRYRHILRSYSGYAFMPRLTQTAFAK